MNNHLVSLLNDRLPKLIGQLSTFTELSYEATREAAEIELDIGTRRLIASADGELEQVAFFLAKTAATALAKRKEAERYEKLGNSSVTYLSFLHAYVMLESGQYPNSVLKSYYQQNTRNVTDTAIWVNEIFASGDLQDFILLEDVVNINTVMPTIIKLVAEANIEIFRAYSKGMAKIAIARN